jgi:GNAT superfamily N-acetyltransferase
MPPSLPTTTPRWAAQPDNDGLLELVRACPMKGGISMLFERSPDFFALSRIQGDGARVCVVDDHEPGKLAAVAAMARFGAVYVDGEPRSADYACDLRVHPAYRGTGLYKHVYDFMVQSSLEEGADLGFTTVMKGNRAMTRIVEGRAGVVPYRHITTLRNFTVHFLLPKQPVAGVTVRTATASDIPAMVDLWTRVNGQKQFAPVWTEDSFKARLAACPGLAIENYRLAYRGDKLVGLLAIWDQSSFKRMVVLSFTGSAQWMRRFYNPVAGLLGVGKLPAPGNPMPYAYATQLCAETAADLQALYVHAYNELRGPDHCFISTMLDVRDPLIQAVSGFVTQAVDIEIYAMDPHGAWQDHPFNRLPVYFDPSIV